MNDMLKKINDCSTIAELREIYNDAQAKYRAGEFHGSFWALQDAIACRRDKLTARAAT